LGIECTPDGLDARPERSLRLLAMPIRQPIVDVRPVSCGALAVAAVVGTRVSTAMAALLDADAAVWSTNARDLAGAFRRFGRSLYQVDGFPGRCPSLERWLADRPSWLMSSPMLVIAEERGQPRHWIAVRGAWISDNAAGSGEWTRIEDAPLGRWSVRAPFAVRPG
jgi:hypothetical protein